MTKITGHMRALMIVVGMAATGLLQEHDVKNSLDFLTGFGCAAVAALFAVLIISELES